MTFRTGSTIEGAADLSTEQHRIGKCTALPACLLALLGCLQSGAPDRASEEATVSSPPKSRTPSIRFVDITANTGIHATYRNGVEQQRCLIVETLGGGIALLDFDCDSRLDVCVPRGGMPTENNAFAGRTSLLFRSLGQGAFESIENFSEMQTARRCTHGTAAGDFNSDGFTDLLITGYGGVFLYENLGDGTFRETARDSGFTDLHWSTGAAWADLDGDGHLDLFVVQYVDWSFENNPPCYAKTGDICDACSPKRFSGLPDLLYWSNGDGRFRSPEILMNSSAAAKGLGVLIGDVDGDHALDIYVANDTTPNELFRNSGAREFEPFGLISATALDDIGAPNGSMGIDLADFNSDGRFDLWVSNFEDENFALYRNEGMASFTHVSDMTGISAVGGLYVGWGTSFSDFDHDGDEDIVCATGHVLQHPINSPVRQQPLLFENQGGGRFRNVADDAGEYMNSTHEGRGLAVGDLDNDGDVDVVISQQNEPVAVLANESPTQGHWIAFQLVGTTSHRDAVGAILTAESGGRKLLRQKKGGGSYLSASDPRIHFGLGAGTSVDRLEVRWPSGTVESFHDLAADRRYLIVENQGMRETSGDLGSL